MNLKTKYSARIPDRIYQTLQLLEADFLRYNHENELNKLRILNCEFGRCRERYYN